MTRFSWYLTILSLATGVWAVDLGSAPRAPSAQADSCYEFYGKARRLGLGWAHVVYVENECEYWLQCSVWTDVDPQPPAMMTVGPGMTEQAQISGDSESEDFNTYGNCHRK